MQELSGFRGYDFEIPVLDLEKKIQDLRDNSGPTGKGQRMNQIVQLQAQCEKLKKDLYRSLTPWQIVQLARHPRRPYTLDYIQAIFTDFVELHGDRQFGEDRAIVAGLAYLDQTPVMILGHQKGRSVQESMERNFGMPHPEGYRKALRLMRMAGRFNIPILTFIDTAGAYPGIGAEERGQATAIAENLREMADLPVPMICCVIGEGGSGGALAIGVGDRLLMLENAWYSVISPEGCASILYRDAAKAPQAAEALKITAFHLKKLNIVDEIISEPLGGAHRNPAATAGRVKNGFKKHLTYLQSLSVKTLLEKRYQKYRVIGHFQEEQTRRLKTSRRGKVKVN